MRIPSSIVVGLCWASFVSAALAQTIVGNPTATQTIVQPPHTSLNVNSMEGIVFADQFPGSPDMGAQINAAIASLGALPPGCGDPEGCPPPNGIVDARGLFPVGQFNNAGQITSAITIKRGVVVYLPCGLFTVSATITLNEGASLYGCQTVADAPPINNNKNGTVLQAAPTLATDVVRLENHASTNCNPSQWIANTRVAFINIYGNGSSGGTSNGITICQQGENSSIHDITVLNAAADGFSFVGNNAGEHFNYNLQASRNGRYGFSFINFWGSQTIAGLGGDDNTSSLVYFNGLNGANLTLLGFKSESVDSVSLQDPVVMVNPVPIGAPPLSDVHEPPPSLNIIGGYALGLGQGTPGTFHTDGVRIENGNASVELQSWDIPNNSFINILNDTSVNNKTIPISNNQIPHIMYAGAGQPLLVVGNGSNAGGSGQTWTFQGCQPGAYDNLVSCFGTATLPVAYADTNYMVDGCTLDQLRPAKMKAGCN